MSVRLNKLLATRGIGARRKCDELIAAGAVRVNGKVVTEPGTRVEPGRDRIEVEGRALPRESPRRTFVLNKPVGVISTLQDPEGRRTVRDFMPSGLRLFPVGRLDADTSGLLLLSNDGDLAHHLMHPRYGVAKRYRVHVSRAPSERQLERLRHGVEFEPGVVSAPAQVWAREGDGDEAVIELALHEGRHRQVRRMCESVGLEVRRLHRWGYGPLRLGDLARGMWRELSEREIAELRAASARPRARAGEEGLTGRRSFDRPRVRPRHDSTFRPGTRAPRGGGVDGGRPEREARRSTRPAPGLRGSERRPFSRRDEPRPYPDRDARRPRPRSEARHDRSGASRRRSAESRPRAGGDARRSSPRGRRLPGEPGFTGPHAARSARDGFRPGPPRRAATRTGVWRSDQPTAPPRGRSGPRRERRPDDARGGRRFDRAAGAARSMTRSSGRGREDFPKGPRPRRSEPRSRGGRAERSSRPRGAFPPARERGGTGSRPFGARSSRGAGGRARGPARRSNRGRS